MKNTATLLICCPDRKGLVAAIATATEIDIRDHATFGIVQLSGSLATLSFYVATAPGRTYVKLTDSSGAPITRPIAVDESAQLPDEAFAYGSVKLIGDAAGVVELSLKS